MRQGEKCMIRAWTCFLLHNFRQRLLKRTFFAKNREKTEAKYKRVNEKGSALGRDQRVYLLLFLDVCELM